MRFFSCTRVQGFAPIDADETVNYVGECSSSGAYLCGECEGDCDGDSDCEGDLVCFQRDGVEAVPGCDGEGGSRDLHAKDICIQQVATIQPQIFVYGLYI